MNWVGKSVKRIDGIEKLTGAANFIADLSFPGMLYAKVLRSTEGHALIKRLEVSKARCLYGVRAVVTGCDCPGPMGECITDQYPMAREKVRFYGEPVAAVIADSEEIARAALELIEVEYEPLPVILDPYAGAQKDAAIIHELNGKYKHISKVYPVEGTNIYQHYKLRKGDADSALTKAAHVFEHSFTYPAIQHVALEPHGAIAVYHAREGMTMWSSTQAPFVVRSVLSQILNLPLSRVRVISPYLGGGFGGKSDFTIEPLVGCLAKAVPGRYVRLILEREEVFTGTTKSRGAKGIYKTGVDENGRIIAEKIDIYWNGGAYADSGVNIVIANGHNATGPYAVDNVSIDSFGVYTNTPPMGALRGYGHPESHWCAERNLDLIAKELGLDPVEFRRRNMLRPGLTNNLGQVIKAHNGDLGECLEKVAEELKSIRNEDPLPPYIKRGKGLALFGKSPCMSTNAQSGAILRFNEDGSANLYVGAVEMGQGLLTALTQFAAEALGLPINKVHAVPGVDTQYSPYEWQTVASHSTWGVGQAVLRAVEDAKEQMLTAAASILRVEKEQLVMKDGRIADANNPEKGVSVSELAVGATNEKGSALNNPIIGRGTFAPKELENPDPVTGQGNVAADWTFGCQGMEVQVDIRTGEFKINKIITAVDPGRVVNPQMAADQIKSAAIMALGEAAFEQFYYSKDGKMRNAGLVDYKVPTAPDIPVENTVIFIESPELDGPYGARGIGEHGTVGVAAALGNALANAVGIEFFDLPINAEKVLLKLP